VHKIRLAIKYLLFRLSAFKLHGIHSPFVFQLYQDVICHKGQFYAFGDIEALRLRLLQDHRRIDITDMGAGSQVRKNRRRRISDLARHSAKPPKLAQLLFRLANHLQPQTILEVGTSLGLTTAYLAAACPGARTVSLEGCPQTAALARQNFQHLPLPNLTLIEGEFSGTLPKALNQLQQVDFVFLDGNHRYEPTISYFEVCLEKRTENSVFVLDDIYWSPEMEKAWKEICRHPAVMISIDLFWLGLVFFRKNQPKQHFVLHIPD
jgi:predicted O-methyltransferase YrrM